MKNYKRRSGASIPNATKLLYGTGSLGYSVVQQTANGLLLFFGTVAHGIPPIAMGIAISLGLLWDAVTDPIVGHISDRANFRLFGRRHGFMFIAVFGVALFNIILWSLPMGFPNVAKFFWFLFGIIILETFNTLFQTPYHALGTELATDYNERSVVQAFKTVFVLIGMIVPTAMMGIMLVDQGEVIHYQNMSYITSMIMLVCGTLTVIGTYNQLPRLMARNRMVERPPKQSIPQIFKGFFATLKLKNFRSLVLGYAVSLMASAFISTIGMHFFTFTFGFQTSSSAVLLGTMFVMTIVSQPFWMWMCRKIDKKPTLIAGLSTVLAGIVYIGIIFLVYHYGNVLPPQPLFVLLPGLALTGVGVGVMFSLPASMLGDLLAVEHAKTKTTKTGVYNAFMTFSYKISQSVTSFVVGILLQLIGFDSKNSDYQTPFVQGGLGWIIMVGVILVIISGILLYRGYNIKKSEVPVMPEPDAE